MACRSATFRELLASPATPRLRGGALQSCRSRRRVPRDLRVGGLVANPVVDLEEGATARLDDVLRRRPAVLTAAAPTPELLRLCRRQGLLLVRLVPGAAQADRDGWVELSVPDAGASGLAALLEDPALTVVVRPDRVVASACRRRHLPRIPWRARAARPVAAGTPVATTAATTTPVGTT